MPALLPMTPLTPEQTLLPPSMASDLRVRVLAELAERLNRIDYSVVLVHLVDTVSADVLAALAEERGIAGHPIWRLAKTIGQKREVLKSATEIKRLAGTPWAIREVVRALGWGEITLIEGVWPTYSVELAAGIYLLDEDAAELRAAIESVAPARCHLIELTSGAIQFLYNGFVSHDGSAAYGGE